MVLFPTVYTFARISILRVARKIGKSKKKNQDQSLVEKRKRLQAKIDTFIRDGRQYLGFVDATPESAIDSGWYDVDDGDDLPSFSNPADVDTSAIYAEDVALPLPSSFGRDMCDGPLRQLAKCEAKLREGQANDALHGLRVAIAKKSFISRTKLRPNAPTSNYVNRLRSYGDVQVAQLSIDHAAKIYSTARNALNILGANDILQHLQVLRKEHLRASTAVVDSNAPHQSQDLLSWIWHTPRNTQNPAFLDESKHYVGILLYFLYLPHFSVSSKLASCEVSS